MERKSTRAGTAGWVAVHLALVAAGCVAWGWLDYQYVTNYWTPDEMLAAAEWIPMALAASAMLFNLRALRKHRPVVHLLGSFGAAVAVVALWWAIIAAAGGWFHAAIGGTPG